MTHITTFPAINSQKISETAYEILHEKIVSREFTPGQRLDLNMMESQMGISRTPLKEALARLEMEGLVEIVPRSGTYVTNPSLKQISDSFDVRLALEIYAVKIVVQTASDETLQHLQSFIQHLADLAASPDREVIYQEYLTVDHQFHETLVSLAGNARLLQLHQRENLHAQMARVRYQTFEKELDLAQKEHEELITALKSRNPLIAQQVMESHLTRAKRSLLIDMNVLDPPTNPFSNISKTPNDRKEGL